MDIRLYFKKVDNINQLVSPDYIDQEELEVDEVLEITLTSGYLSTNLLTE